MALCECGINAQHKWKQVPTNTDTMFREKRMPTEHVPLCIIPQPTSQSFREETNGCQNRRKRNEDDGHRLSGRCDDRSIEAEDITIVHDTLRTYEKATGANIRITKDKEGEILGN